MLNCVYICLFIFFFFQAEDGIRDDLVTGVQTCALPISIFSKSTAFLAVRFDRDAYTRFSSCWSRLEKSTSWVLAFCMPQQPKTHSQKSIYSYYLLCGHGTIDICINNVII